MTGAEERTRAHLTIDGRVQGVWFRAATREAAERIGVTGWVRNLPDGRVEAVLEGEPARVEEMIHWCRQGPPAARVDQVEVEPEPWRGEFERFAIRRSIPASAIPGNYFQILKIEKPLGGAYGLTRRDRIAIVSIF